MLIFEMMTGTCAFQGDTIEELHRRILHTQVEYPHTFEDKAKSLVKLLLVKDPRKRHGCGKAGPQDVKKHKWFKGIRWDVASLRGLTAPFLPNVESADDTSMFTSSPASGDDSVPPSISPQQQSQYFNELCPHATEGIDLLHGSVIDSALTGA